MFATELGLSGPSYSVAPEPDYTANSATPGTSCSITVTQFGVGAGESIDGTFTATLGRAGMFDAGGTIAAQGTFHVLRN